MNAMTRQARIDRMLALDDLELEEEGGCGACGLEADDMCVACGQCNCDRHDNCVRPAGDEKPPARTRTVGGITWICVEPGLRWTSGQGPEAYQLEHRTRSRFELGDTGWYLFGGGDRGPGAAGEYLARTLIYAMEGAAGLVALR
jgi:hypothetical protein